METKNELLTELEAFKKTLSNEDLKLVHKKNEYASLAILKALKIYAQENDLDGKPLKDVAAHCFNFTQQCFNYIPNSHDRVTNYLQGLGLDIPYWDFDVIALYYADKKTLETRKPEKYKELELQDFKVLERYFPFMSMRLSEIAKKSKDFKTL